MSPAEYSTEVLGERVRSRRRELGMTQVEFARLLEVSQPNVSDIEHGRAGVSVERLLRIAEILQCGPSDLTRVDERK